jgi:hypothetical protein
MFCDFYCQNIKVNCTACLQNGEVYFSITSFFLHRSLSRKIWCHPEIPVHIDDDTIL